MLLLVCPLSILRMSSFNILANCHLKTLCPGCLQVCGLFMSFTLECLQNRVLEYIQLCNQNMFGYEMNQYIGCAFFKEVAQLCGNHSYVWYIWRSQTSCGRCFLKLHFWMNKWMLYHWIDVVFVPSGWLQRNPHVRETWFMWNKVRPLLPVAPTPVPDSPTRISSAPVSAQRVSTAWFSSSAFWDSVPVIVWVLFYLLLTSVHR